mmetsp:Transcript_43930/g.116087  ORF Transcript_43930/g.116087 Transcript_43930/m.116087 type:complete len:228 (+) Transcript_43930:485-1168(+)
MVMTGLEMSGRSLGVGANRRWPLGLALAVMRGEGNWWILQTWPQWCRRRSSPKPPVHRAVGIWWTSTRLAKPLRVLAVNFLQGPALKYLAWRRRGSSMARLELFGDSYLRQIGLKWISAKSRPRGFEPGICALRRGVRTRTPALVVLLHFQDLLALAPLRTRLQQGSTPPRFCRSCPPSLASSSGTGLATRRAMRSSTACGICLARSHLRWKKAPPVIHPLSLKSAG